MASFVEQATLTIDDGKALSSIKTLNNAINNLIRNARRLNGIKLFETSTKKTQREINNLARSINKLPKSRTITVNTRNVTTNVTRNQGGNTQPRQPRQPRGGQASQLAPHRTRGAGGAIAGPFAGLVRIASATITATGAITIARASLEAVNEAQAETTRERSIFRSDPGSIQAITSAATAAALATSRLDLTRTRQIATDLRLGGITNENLPQFTQLFSNTESAIGALFPGLESSVTLFNNKMINLANASDDIKRSAELVKGGAQGIAAAGESFNAPTTTAALRGSGLAPTINAKGLANFILLTDALGQPIASGVSRLRKELFIPTEQAGEGSGISKGAVANLNEKGIRGFTAEQQALFAQDPATFIETVLAPRIRANGVDTNNREQLQKFVQEAGFNATSQRLLIGVLTSIDERQRQLQAVSGLDPTNPNAGTEGNLLLATKDLIASFNTLSSTVLTPLAEAVAPSISSLATFVEKVALTGSTLDQLKLGAEAAGAAFLVFKGGQSIVSMLLSPLTGSATALNGSAAALSQAAVQLGGASVAGGIGGAAGSPKAGLRTSFTGFGILGLAGLALNEFDRQQKINAIPPEQRPDAAQAEFREALQSSADLNNTLKSWLTSIAGKTISDTIAPPTVNPLQNAVDSATAPKSELQASMDAIIGKGGQGFEAAAQRFDQTFDIGATTVSNGLTTAGATAGETMASALVSAGATIGDTIASRIAAAVANIVINVPKQAQAAPAAANTGVTAPTE